MYVCISFSTKVPINAKKYFFSYSSVPFQNFSFATPITILIPINYSSIAIDCRSNDNSGTNTTYAGIL